MFIAVTLQNYNEIEQFQDKYIVHILPKTNEDGTISCIETITDEYPNIETIINEYNLFLDKQNKRILDRQKTIKLKELKEYDESDNINGFIINGEHGWIHREERVSVNYSTTIIKNSGQKTTELWLNSNKYELDCDLILQLLAQLEIYAKDCYNITSLHKANIEAIDNINDLNNYDFTTGYPKKLNFNI